MKIGVLGSGQLGRMLAIAGIPLGFEFVFYDKESSNCTSGLGRTINAEFTDFVQLERFAEQVDIITYEFENVPITAVDFLSEKHIVSPAATALGVSQDRLSEKRLFSDLNIPIPDYFPIDNAQQLQEVASQYQHELIVKTRRFGYDGKGQAKLSEPIQAQSIVTELVQTELIAEQCIEFEREVSIIAVRSREETRFYPLVENIHRNGILTCTMLCQDEQLQALAEEYTTRLLEKLDYIGVLVVEFFVVQESLIANEYAPRVHNSGHWTIDAAATSQFENHLRAILNWPLGSTSLTSSFVMFNLIGTIPDKSQLLAVSDVHLHDYGKTPQSKRKLGHITLCNPDEERVAEITRLLAMDV